MAKVRILSWSLIFIALSSFNMFSQNDTITSAEYFIDIDLGVGSGTTLPAKDGSFDQDSEDVEATISTVGLFVGTHTVFARMKDSKGNWGSRRATRFLVQAPSNRYIAAAEYFIDIDPGRGNGISISPFDGSFDGIEERVQATINTTGLSLGRHTLFVRMKDSEGNWGPNRGISFTIGQTTGPLSNFIAAAEYFVDSDPGKGNGTPMIVTDGAFDATSEEVEGTFNTTGFSIGDHLIYVRMHDVQGRWGEADSELVTVLWSTSVENTANDPIPKNFILFQNYPNPANDGTVIRFGVPEQAWVTLKIYNSAGQLVCTLVDGMEKPGYKNIFWDFTNYTGQKCSSGIYFCKFKTNKFDAIRRILILR